MAEETAKSWWTTLPGILTATAAVITAVTGLLLGLGQLGVLGGGAGSGNPGPSAVQPTSSQAAVATPTPAAEPATWVAATGELRLKANEFIDLATGRVSQGRTTDSDFYLYPTVDGYWLSAAIAENFALGKGSDRAACVAALTGRADNHIDLSSVRAGQVVCVETHTKQIAALTVSDLPRTGSPSIEFTYTVWD